MNKWTGTGRIGSEPELRKTQNGKSVISVNIAVDRLPINGQKQDPDWVQIVAWSGTAEFINNYAHKGDTLLVEGRIETGSYTDRSGARKETFKINAERVELFAKVSGNTQSKPMKESQFNTGPAINISDDDLPF